MGNTKVVVKEAAQKPQPEVQQPISISSVSATKVNELTVTFANAVGSPSAITFSVKKGNSAVETASTKWSDDKTSVVIRTVAKMTKGTYTVTAKDGETETTGSAEVVAQYVASIEILNNVALTGTHKFSTTGGAIEGGECYVYYDVLDQYGESLRSSTSIEWSTSTAKPTDKRTEGKLILTRSDQKAFTYGEQIYVTGVYGKTGVSVTKTLTIGAKQSLDTVEVVGFAKKGTNTLLTSLPAGFKEKAYYMLFTVKDQNGNSMSVENEYLKSGDTQVTFVSDNVLVVKEIKDGETIVNIDGTDYKAVLVTPGQNVDKGGEVTITAIANKTGKKTECKLVVGNAQILKSFTMSAPDGVVADGETVEIPFVALDQDGKDITAFTTLANQTDFSNLTLNSSEGVLYLEEQNDGTAKLKYADSKTRWESDSADGIDRPISLTSVVVGGDTSNLMIYVSDKARPDAIKDVDMSSVLVEGGEIKYTLSDFTFLDQYGREIKGFSRDDSNDRFANANRGYVKDNGFFKAAASGTQIGGTDYSGYSFGVKVEYKGNANYLTTVDTPNTLNAANTSAVIKDESGVATGKTLVTSSGAVTASTDNQTVKFTIVKQKTGSQLEEVSTAKTKSFKIVNINKVSSFEIKDLKKQFVGTDASDYANLYLAKGAFNKTTLESAVTLDKGIDPVHIQTVKVVGKFNGESVTIPHGYYTIKGDKVGSAVSGSAIAESAKTEDGHKLTKVTTDASKLAYKDLYDANSASGTRKDTTDTIVATIYSRDNIKLDVAKKTLTISDANSAATTIKAGDAYTYLPTNTKIGSVVTGSSIGYLNVNVTVAHGDANNNLPGSEAEKFFTEYGPKGFKVVDQYDVDITDDVVSAGKLTFKVSNAVENASGYADNNFTVNSNDSVNAYITGAELGDKFTLTVTADQNGAVSKDITITVGADRSAFVSSNAAGNSYKNQLVKNWLEPQRTAGLGN